MTLIAHVTDLHLDGYPDAAAKAADLLRHEPVDVILLGGDNVAEDHVAHTAAMFRQTHPGAAFAWVMGNHDLWERNYTDVFKFIDVPGAHYLETANMVLDRLTVVGTYGHYDYSAGDPSIPFADYAKYRHGTKRWMDWKIGHLDKSDPEIAAELAARFAGRYAAAIQRGKPIAVVMHTLPDAVMNAWPISFWSAYGANSDIGKIICSYEQKPVALFCGHTHKAIVHDGWGFPMINPGSDYGTVRVALVDTATRHWRIVE